MKNKIASQIILRMKRRLSIYVFLVVSSVIRLPTAEALTMEGEGKFLRMAPITVYITISQMPCTIKGKGGSDIIDVDFGNEVMTTLIDGDYNSRPIEYTFDCPGSIAKNQMQIQITGDSASFDNQALKTEKTDLGIAIMNNGARFPINSWVGFDYPDVPKLTAVPVKKVGARLKGGVFSAGATMKIEYQ